MKTKPLALALFVLGWLVLTAAAVVAQEQPRPGGVLKVAMIGEPPSLDLQSTTAVITQQITWHVYETLATSLQCAWPGGWCNEDKEKLLAELARATDVKKRRALDPSHRSSRLSLTGSLCLSWEDLTR
jgi:hypothetical protein